MIRFSRPPVRSPRWRSVLAVAALLLATSSPFAARAGDWHHGHGHYRYYRPVYWGRPAFVGPVWYGRPFVSAYVAPPAYYYPPVRYYAPPVYYAPAPVYGYPYGYAPGPQVSVQLGFGVH
jgi:hypothetical protein